MKKYILFLALLFIAAHSIAADLKYSRAKIWFDGKPAIELARLGIDLSEGSFRKDVWFISDFSETEILKIQQAGFRVEIQIDDVKSFYVSRNNNSEKTNSTRSTCPNHVPDYPVPTHFHPGSMGGFFTYSELQDILDSMTLLYPNLITQKQPIDSITSIEGNPIYFLKISDNPNVDENEPEVLYDAIHHAREPEALTQLVYYMWYLLENYSTDSTIKALVDNTEMYFVPCINPDGYMYNEFTNPAGGGMWRKNRRDNLDGTFGVDPNRNYGYEWGYDLSGSSINTGDETYRGTAPFSEPEIQAMRDFANSRHFRFALNYHTFGDHLILPWDYTADSLTPDSVQYEYYGNTISQFSNYHVGTTNQTLLYLVNGGADDWMYGEQNSKSKIFSFTPEVGQDFDGFWPASNRIIPLSKENVNPNIMTAKLAGHYGKIIPNEPRYVTQLSNYFTFSFRQLGLDTAGSYTISLVPVSSNIISNGSPVIISNLSLMQKMNDSISFALNPSINSPDEIKYVIKVDNGLYVESDTISQLFGNPITVFSDNGNDILNWNTLIPNSWGSTTEDFVSSPSSITDSPYQPYMSNTYNPLTLNLPVSLSGAVDARLTFYAKWNIESQFDYLQVLASPDNINWTPLCGNYTVTGASTQAAGEPLYDMNHFHWVKEEMSLNDFLGQSIRIRFALTSDAFIEYDGFYFDDLKIEILPNTTGIQKINASAILLSRAFPNPSSEIARVNYSNAETGSSLVVYNTFGQLQWKKYLSEKSGEIQIPVNNFSSGMYSYFIILPDGTQSNAMKMIVNK